MGLVEYAAQFFAFNSLQQVKRKSIQYFGATYIGVWIIVFGNRLRIATLKKNR